MVYVNICACVCIYMCINCMCVYDCVQVYVYCIVCTCVPPTTPSSHQKAVAFDPVINFWALKAPPRAKNGHFGAPNGQNQAICGGMATHKACFGWIGQLGCAWLVDKITSTMLTTCLVATCSVWKLRGPGF